ncbi:MAG: PRC-barrel domain-containing protein [Candidatus Altiarchaeota archaeon]
MHFLKDLIGKNVKDGAKKDIALVDGLNITLIDYKVYLRMTGGEIKEIRGREEEFLAMEEVNEIGDEITLYKDLKNLISTIKKLEIEKKDSYRISQLIGMDVIDFDDKHIGTINNVGISEEGRKPYYIVEGPKIEKIRGNKEETLPFIEVDSIQNSVKIDLPYDTLSKKIRERSTRGPW